MGSGLCQIFVPPLNLCGENHSLAQHLLLSWRRNGGVKHDWGE